uniref:CRAL-TRIO domain-containing protein n=1 Tax=Kwoniella bestiolae CBS 10118 TaxID=1296100 RepID=A0A1B9GB84_9TREE|nr:hypothetical protein I302_03141 [Kwoniella bestiolae CBS 10118]OCF28285.1 hypothetical protein I302_03141 [Kwoniella bestiolae CBS 10118]
MATQSPWTSLLSPPPSVTPEAKPPLTQDQEAKLKCLIDHFGSPDYALPVKQHAEEKTPIGDREMIYLEGLTKSTIESADSLLGPPNNTTLQSKTGKNLALGFSNKGQPILTFFVYMLERAKDLMCAGVTNTFVIFNWAGKKSGPSLPLSVIKSTNHILSSYYPETLGLSVFQGMPWIFKTLINLVWPFVDPVTKKKVSFGSLEGAELVKEGVVDPSQLLKEAGGNVDLPYDHATYWPALLETCVKIREEEEQRWRALGERQVGREEKLFKRPIPTA